MLKHNLLVCRFRNSSLQAIDEILEAGRIGGCSEGRWIDHRIGLRRNGRLHIDGRLLRQRRLRRRSARLLRRRAALRLDTTGLLRNGRR
jgi:hypothetical protein